MSEGKHSRVKLATIVALVAGIGAGAAVGYWIASSRAPTTRHEPATTSDAGSVEGRKVLYWYDPMVPNQHFDKPGKSPFMDMQLVARYADEDGEAAGIRIDPQVKQNLGIRLAPVTRGTLADPVIAVGSIRWNERQVAVVQTRTAGFVARVYGRAPGDVIAKGAPLADLLVPEWAGAQAEFLALLRAGDDILARAAQERLQLLGMPPELISKVKSSGQPQPVITILAPIGGVVQTLDVRTGMSLDAGMTLARINGLDPVWLEAAVPESQSAGVTVGRRVSVALAAYPGGQTLGKVIAVLPETDQESRTLRVRAELPNRDGRLRAGMAATVSLTTQGDEEVLLVPSEAVIRTGKRTLVLVSLDGGRFHPTEVTLGHEAQGKSAVLAGLREGQSVVTSGQFLIDSEASLKGVLTRSQSETEKSSSSQSAVVNAVTLHEAIGDVESVSASEITLSHGPVESLGWSAMTMPFRLSRPDLATGVKTGDRVRFAFRKDEDGYVIERLSKSGGAP